MTPTELIAISSDVLEGGGFRSIRRGFSEWSTPTTRLFEDEYNIVGLAVFMTCDDLLHSWADLQASLVDVMAHHVGHAESKAWDGYLVLLTSAVAPSDSSALSAVRYDTTRLRKLVATGESLGSAADVYRVLGPLLPLAVDPIPPTDTAALALLPKLLEEHNIPTSTTEALVAAFTDQQPLMAALHRHRWPS